MKKIKNIFGKENFKSTKKPIKNILDKKNFAKNMIENEISIEMENFTLKHIQNIMNLYSQAIDYYVATYSNKALYFKQKMNILLLKPSVRKLLENECEKNKKKSSKKKNKEKKKKVKTKKSLKRDVENTRSLYGLRKKNFQINTHLSSNNQSRQIKNILNSHNQIANLKNKVIDSSIKLQKDEIQFKIEARRMKSMEIYRSRNRGKSKKNIEITDNVFLNDIV